VKGTRWLLSLADWWGKGVLLAGIVGVTLGAIHISHFPSWLVVIAAALVVLVVLGEGAYRVWLEADTARLVAEKNVEDADKPAIIRNTVRNASSRVPLEARYDQSEPYLHETPQEWIFEHRIGIHNPRGNQMAAHVRLEFVDMSPRPRDLPPDTPYAVPMLKGGDERIGISLPPGEQEYWVIGSTATGSDGTMSAGPFTTRDPRWRGTPWQYDPTYPWRLRYRIVTDDAPAAGFSVVMMAVDGRIRCQIER
jgi:hypothetical protein